MIDDAFASFLDAGSVDLILFWCVVQYSGQHVSLDSTNCHCNYLPFSLS